jgi:FdrA protein
MSEPDLEKFLATELRVVNVGLESFARELEQQGVAVVHVDWAPPAGGDADLADLLSKLGT